MLDTNTVSYIVRGKSRAARRRLLSLKDDEIACVSAISESEIRYGLAKRPEATALRVLMEGFLASIRVMPWHRTEAAAYGELRARLERRQVSLGNMDMMIAAHAVAVGAVLLTSDKSFRQIGADLVIENWATDVPR